jgi:hypothetical protein
MKKFDWKIEKNRNGRLQLTSASREYKRVNLDARKTEKIQKIIVLILTIFI